MPKKTSLLLFISFFVIADINTQRFMQGYGATISVLTGKVRTSGSTYNYALQQTTLTYFPRYNFIENENSSVSIGAPVGIGIGIATNTYGDDAGIAFAYDLPVVLDYNIGCKSTIDNEQTFGGYLGLGFGYYKVSISNSQYSDFKGATYGPIFRGGVRIGSAKESWKGHGLTIGVYYKKGLEKDKLTTIGFNVLLDV
ncbi:MAG: hypothetical protein ABI675_04795 [Chitinophagaceae bacterium]